MFLFSQLCSAETAAFAACSQSASATLVSLQGSLYFDPDGHGRWQAAQLNQALCEGSRVRVETDSRASLLLPSGITLRLSGGSVLTLNRIGQQSPTLLDMAKGFIHFISRTPKQLQITTPVANAGPEGTEFALQADSATASLWVYEGGVRFFNGQGEIRLHPGEAGQTQLGQAPRAQLDIKPRDAVNWALYYPPLLDYPSHTQPVEPGLSAAIADFRRGRTDLALTALSALTPAQQTPQLLKARGAMRLSVGQTDAALQDINTLLAANPRDADALSLQAILALSQNRKAEADRLASQAVAADGGSAAAHSALSYVQQGRFELEPALASAARAAELAPHDALVWARLAELQLALGRRGESRDSAAKAFQLDPNLERTQTVAGFSHLFDTEIDQARRSFETAIRLDSSSPLARLGLGLAKIRDGDLEQGRQELEIAAVLDPENALIRSYLGKAYYEERRDSLAADQLELAKERDPNDPTPYFYDAIRKQTTNRPIEALADMQQATRLNDNRAVYRSKLLLDEDLAAKSASLGRIYNDLGFQWMGLVQGWRSVTEDPSNFSAHRLLADNYASVPRHEITRVSELLQSQLLQPANMTPIQPGLLTSNPLVLEGLGPTTQSFNEFNPLYTRNRLALQLSAIAGGNNTWGNEAIHSGIWDRFSYSLGQFHYSTDGFRENNDVETNLYTAFAQFALTPSTNIQFEFRDNNTESGDISSQFFAADVDEALRQNNRTTSARTGLHYQIDANSDFLASLSHLKRETNQNSRHIFTDEFGFLQDKSRTNRVTAEAFHIESQYLKRTKYSNYVFGLSYLGQDQNIYIDEANKASIFGFELPCICNTLITDRGGNFINSYVYSNVNWLNYLPITLGVSFDSMDSRSFGTVNKVNPKVGLKWNYAEQSTLRAAYFTSVKRPLISDQTIEPTQIAGFNQFFDDITGSMSERYGVGIDHQLTRNLFVGAETSWRNLQVPIGEPTKKRQREHRDHGYIYWAINDQFSVNFDINYETVNRELFDSTDLTPGSIKTLRMPLSVNYFAPNGIFTKFTATNVHQTIDKQTGLAIKGLQPTMQEGTDDFWTIDAQFGYRLPKRLGIVSIGVKNLFDEKFNYQEFYFQNGVNNPIMPTFQPGRYLYTQITIAFN
ncbi:FecR domain-containing protein [Methylomonas koyamae]|uniref:FecR domain-containing protein n=1 Tax=Methylomonas koyamae TaxID=702114 RepID=UPI0016433A96|nr:FecR domain-containing protein [Methylomonas koyamae]